ncbi:MAG: hypothetical protein JW816_01600 [Candidatus Buchananbacteria bacterium]|nr:hypothetical protein [Candidatus Buchananbacteria bacterium]
MPDTLTMAHRLVFKGGKIQFIVDGPRQLFPEIGSIHVVDHLKTVNMHLALRDLFGCSLMEITIPDATLTGEDGRRDGAMYGWVDCANQKGVFCQADSPYRSGLFLYLLFSEGYGWDNVEGYKSIRPKHPPFSQESLRYVVFGLACQLADQRPESPDFGLGEFIVLAFWKALYKHADSKFLWELLTCIKDTSFQKSVWQTASQAVVPLIEYRQLYSDSIRILLHEAILKKASKEAPEVMDMLQDRLQQIDPNKTLDGPEIDLIRNWNWKG